MIDIIIPVLNEEKILSAKAKYYRALSTKARVVFVDGGSEDKTVVLARHYGEVFSTIRNRSAQKNYGAQLTKGDILLFAHVDSYLDHQALDHVVSSLEGDVIGGCFTMHIDDDKKIFRFYENIVNYRAKRLGVIDGDLGLFVKREAFNQLGQFDFLPIMDDIAFSKKMRKAGELVVLPQSITVSSRKWHEQGFVNTFKDYSLAYIQHWTGLPFYPKTPLLSTDQPYQHMSNST